MKMHTHTRTHINAHTHIYVHTHTQSSLQERGIKKASRRLQTKTLGLRCLWGIKS